MLDGGVSRRYAKALFGIAEASNSVDTFEEDLKTMVSLIEGDTQAHHFWMSRMVQPSAKKAAFEAALSPLGASQHLISFLKILVDKGREGYLIPMLTEFTRLADEYRSVEDVDVRTACELSAEAASRISARVEASLGKTVRLNVTVEPELLGGLVIRIGDKVMDGSLSTRLSTLKRAMSTGIGVKS